MPATKTAKSSRVDELTAGVRKSCTAIRKTAEATSKGWIATGVKILELDRWLRESFALKRSDTITFVQEEAGLSRRSIFYFLRAAEVFGNLPNELQCRLEVSAIKMLAARTVPEEVQEKARKLAKSEMVTIDRARELIGKKQRASRIKRQRITLDGCTLIIESDVENLDLLSVFQKALEELQSKRGAA